MTDTTSAAAAAAPAPAAIGITPAPAQHLHVVASAGEEMRQLRAARAEYARAIDAEREVERALARAEADADVTSFSRQAARAYIEHRDLDDSTLDASRARAAMAALPELKARRDRARIDREQARAVARASISAVPRAERSVAHGKYAVGGVTLRLLWVEAKAIDLTLGALGENVPPLTSTANPVSAVAIDGAGGGYPTHDARYSKWYCEPDQEAIHNAAQRRSYEQLRDLRALWGDDLVPWPF